MGLLGAKKKREETSFRKGGTRGRRAREGAPSGNREKKPKQGVVNEVGGTGEEMERKVTGKRIRRDKYRGGTELLKKRGTGLTGL